MEQQKEDSQIDYWLIQYQRLMDRKPQSLVNQVCLGRVHTERLREREMTPPTKSNLFIK